MTLGENLGNLSKPSGEQTANDGGSGEEKFSIQDTPEALPECPFFFGVLAVCGSKFCGSAGFRSKVTNGKLRLRLHRVSFRLRMIDNAHRISLARWNARKRSRSGCLILHSETTAPNCEPQFSSGFRKFHPELFP